MVRKWCSSQFFSVFRVEFWLEYAEVKLGQNTINSTPHRLALDSSQSWAAQFFRVFVFSPLFVGLLRVWEFFAAAQLKMFALSWMKHFVVVLKKSLKENYYSFLSTFIECEKWTGDDGGTKRMKKRVDDAPIWPPCCCRVGRAFVRVFMFYQL